jgi:hypothetical protein
MTHFHSSVACLLLLAVLAFPCVGAEPAAKAKLPELLIGDVYKVSLVGQTTDDAIEWVLVKQTEEWIVLGILHTQDSYECNEYYGIVCDIWNMINPFGHRIVAEDVPLLGYWLTKQKPIYSKGYVWIPRGNIQKIEHAATADSSMDYAAFQGDSPALEGKCCVIDKAAKQFDADSIAEAESQVTITKDGLPTKLALADVRLIWQWVPFDYAKFKAEHEKKQPAK